MLDTSGYEAESIEAVASCLPTTPDLSYIT